MPAIRSFLSLSVLAACLAHAVADGHLGGEGGEWGGGPGGPPSGPPAGWQGSDYGSSGWNDWPSGGEHRPPPPHVPDMPVAPITCEPTTITNHITVPPVTVTITKEGMPPPPPAPVTVTVTSVKEHKITITSVHPTTVTAPCTSVSVTTKHVTEWQQAPPGCWCGRPGMPPPNGHDGAPMWPWPAGDAPIFTTHIPDFMPGRSSIPASEAVVTGVTDGPAPPPPAPTSSGTAFSSFGDIPSNSAQPSEIAGFPSIPDAPPVGFPPPPAAETTTAAAASSSIASETLGPAPPLPPLTAQAAVESSSSTTTSAAESTLSTSTTTTASAAALETSAPAPTSSAGPEGPPGPLPNVDRPSSIDPATLDLKNAYTLGIGRRAPRPTVVA